MQTRKHRHSAFIRFLCANANALSPTDPPHSASPAATFIPLHCQWLIIHLQPIEAPACGASCCRAPAAQIKTYPNNNSTEQIFFSPSPSLSFSLSSATSLQLWTRREEIKSEAPPRWHPGVQPDDWGRPGWLNATVIYWSKPQQGGREKRGKVFNTGTSSRHAATVLRPPPVISNWHLRRRENKVSSDDKRP